MKLPLPTPADALLGAVTSSLADVGTTARRSVSGGAAAARDGVELALELPARAEELLRRAGTVLGEAEGAVRRVAELLDRADRLVTAIEATRQRADEVAQAVDATREHADEVADAVEATRKHADEVASAVDETRRKADEISSAVGPVLTGAEQASRRVDQAVDAVDALLARSDSLLDSYEPTLRRLAPQAERLVSSLDGREIDAAVALVDRLPVVLAHLDEDVLPILRQMDLVGPDVHELLEAVQDVRRVLTGLPGAKLLRRRGDDEG